MGGPAPAVGGTTSGIALGRPPVQFDQKLPFGKVGPPLPHLGPDEVDDGLVFGLPVPQRLGSMKAPVGFPFAGHGVCGCLGIAGKLFDDLQALFDEPPSIACLLGDSPVDKSLIRLSFLPSGRSPQHRKTPGIWKAASRVNYPTGALRASAGTAPNREPPRCRRGHSTLPIIRNSLSCVFDTFQYNSKRGRSVQRAGSTVAR